MTSETTETRPPVYEQIKKLIRWDRIEVTTIGTDKNPFSSHFLATSEYHAIRLYYFIEADNKTITVNTNYDPCYLRLRGRKKIPIRKITHIAPLDERVETK